MGNTYNRKDCLNELEEIRNECDYIGWDGYTAEEIPEYVIDKTIAIIENIPDEYLPRFIAPTGYESIQLEYEYGEYYLEIEIDEFEIKVFNCWDLDNGGHCSRKIEEYEIVDHIKNFLETGRIQSDYK